MDQVWIMRGCIDPAQVACAQYRLQQDNLVTIVDGHSADLQACPSETMDMIGQCASGAQLIAIQ